MKIVIDARSIRTSTGRYARKLLTNLEKIDSENEYHVLIQPEDQKAWKPKNKNFHMHVVDIAPFSFAEQIKLLKVLKDLKPDLTHFWMPQQPILYRRKKVTTIHDLTLVRFRHPKTHPLIYWVKQQVFKMVIKSGAKRSEYVVTPSKNTKKDVITYTGIDSDKVIVTYESADKMPGKAAKPPKKVLAQEPFVLYVGNAFPYKNIDTLMAAHLELKKKHPGLHLALAGKKDLFYEQLEEKANKENLHDVHFLGFVSDQELMWLYQNAKVYVFPSLSEGFGLPGLEAMQYELPVAASDASCLPEIYGDGALYFDPEDPKDMANTIEKILSDKKTRAKLIKDGQKVLKKYSWEKMAKETLEIYERAIS